MINQTLEVKPDADGEERMLQADVVLELDMKLYQEEDHEVIHGCVYTVPSVYAKRSGKRYWKVFLSVISPDAGSSDRIEVKETQGKILQICHSQGKSKNRQNPNC